MTMGVMITHGGAHTPDMWADQSVNQIVELIQVEPTSPIFVSALEAKEKLRADLKKALTSDHAYVQENALKSLTNPIETAMKSLIAVTDKSPFAEHFRKQDVLQHVREIFLVHFNTEVSIEQSWQKDKAGA